MSQSRHDTQQGSSQKYVANTVDLPSLVDVDASPNRIMLRAYDQYFKDVTQRAKQLLNNAITSEVVTPVDLKICFDAEWLESVVHLGFIGKLA